jgi:glycerophosphoryl diester phosphodiesterase
MLFLLGGLVLLWGLVNLFVTLFQAASFALLTVRLYERVGGGQAAEAPAVSVAAPVEAVVSRLSARAVLGVLLIAAALCGGIGYYLLSRVKIDREVVAIGHRGAAGRAPENTLAAVDAAIEDGADLVEIDVQETKDGRVVVIHDSDFMKLAGVATKIWDASYEEARAIDVGSWFGPEYADQRIATLEEVLYRCKGKTRVVIELKYYGHDERLEERVVEIVERAGMASDIVIMSLKQDGIRRIRELRPPWTIGLLLAKAAGDPTKVDADFLAVHTGLASRRFIREAHRAGKEVYVWTVNDPIHMSTMIGRGVDGVITDDPALLNQVMARRAGLSSPERVLLEAAFWLGMVPKDPGAEVDVDTGSSPEIGLSRNPERPLP